MLCVTRRKGADLSGRGVICCRRSSRLRASRLRTRGRGGAAQLDWRWRQRTVVPRQRGRVQTVQALSAAGRLQGRALSTLWWCLRERWLQCTVAQDPKRGQSMLQMNNT